MWDYADCSDEQDGEEIHGAGQGEIYLVVVNAPRERMMSV